MVAAGSGCWCSPALLPLRELGLWFTDALVWPAVLAARRRRAALAPVDRRRGARAAPPRRHAERAAPRRAAPAGRRGEPRARRRRARGRRRPALPVAQRRAAPGARRRCSPSSSWSSRLSLILAPLVAAAGAQPHRRARRAHPLAGARRGGRPPARLRAADARAHPEARRRPARGRHARPPPGARAARVARRASRGPATGDGLAAALEAAAAEVEEAHGVAGRGRHGRRRAARRARRRRSSRPPARRWSTRPSSPATAPVALYAEVEPRAASQVFVRDRGPGLRPGRGPRRPARRARLDRRAGWTRHGGTRRASTARRAAGTEVELGAVRAMTRPSSSSTTTHLFRSGVRAELDGLVEVVGEAPTVEDAVRLVLESGRPTSCCSTSTCPAAAASR